MSILDLYSRSFLNNAKTNELYNPTGFFDVQSSATYAAFLDTPAYFNYDISSAESERDAKLLELAEATGFNLIEENRFNTENDLQGRTILPSDSEKETLYKNNLDELIIAQREAAPDIWQGIKTNQEIFDEIAEKRNLAEDISSVKTEQAEGFAARYIALLTGGLAAGMVDPVNIATLPLGVGAFGTGFKAFLQTAGANALLNMGVETALLPEYAKMREAVGRPVTSGEMAAQVGLSGVATFGLMGLAKGIEVAAPKVKSALVNAPSVINTTSRSLRKKRKAAITELETIIDTPEVPIPIKQEAKEALREVETALDYPPQLEETIAQQYEDTGRLYNDDATVDAIESDAITLHKEALLETATALSEGKKPSYNPLLLETDIPYRNFYTPPQIEVDRYIANLRSQQPDFQAALKQTTKKTLKAQIGYNPIRLNQFLKQKGGIADFNGELEARGLNTSNSIGLIREKYKKRRDGTYDININNRNNVGNVGTSFDWDRQKQLAFDAGYFPEFDNADAITMSAFFDKIAEDRFRQPVYDAQATRDIESYNNQFADVEESQFAYESERLALANEYGISTDGTFDEINNAIFEYEAIQTLQQKYAKQNDFINQKADEVYQSLLRLGFNEDEALAQHVFFTSTMHAFLRNYGVIASDIESIINDYFSRLNISRGDTAMQQDIRFAPEDFDTFTQSTRADLGISLNAVFNEIDYRPSVVNWAKNKYGDKTAPDGSLAWQNFTQWFGDSKVVNDAGEPLVVYHGTKAMIDDNFAFDPKKIGTNATAEGYGFYFTTDIDTAKGYQSQVGGSLAEVYLNIKNPMSVNAKKISKADLTKIIKNMVEKQIAKYSDEIADYKDSFLSDFVDTYSTNYNSSVKEVVNLIFDNNENALDQISELSNVYGDKLDTLSAVRDVTGFDAVVSNGFGNTGVEGGTIYVSWFPNQIKLVNNQGAFSANDARILFQGKNSRDKGKSYRDVFIERYEAAESIKKEAREQRFRIQSDGNGFVTVYHGTSAENAAKIRETGRFDRGSFFSPNKAGAEYYGKQKHKKGEVIEIKVDPRDIEYISAAGEIYAPKELLLTRDGGFWSIENFDEPTILYQRSKKQAPDATTPSLEGFKPISQRELIERKMEGKSQAKKPQKGMQGETNLFDQSELAQDTLFQGQAKGAISFAERNSFIQMFQGADVSTFIHEMGHFNMRIMHDIVNSPNATKALIDDYNILRDFVGAEEGVRFNVEQEEKIARAFELYVREGKAPSDALKGVFYKLATWLREIYRKVSDLDVTINDEVRQVFDKWIAPVEAAPVNTFVDTPASFKPILDDVQFEPNAVMDANMAEFVRLVKDLPDEKIFMDNGVEISYANIMQEIENDNAYLAAMNTCAR